jgi:uncharacterized damage-inducible protein DinB
MDMLQELRRLFAYDAWANREVLAGLSTLNAAPARPVQLLAHILSAERLWLERLQQKPQSYAVWPDFTLPRCKQEIDELAQLWGAYIAELTSQDLLQTVEYKNSKGENWSNSILDVLMHVVMHSAYHRGQIAFALRAAGHTPVYTDLIHAIRQKLVE